MKVKIILGTLLYSSLLTTANAAVYTTEASKIGENRGSFNSRLVVEMLGDRWKVVDGSYQIRGIGSGEKSHNVTRNYHIFDIPSLAADETVTDVTFNLPHPKGSYQSPEDTETFGLFDIDQSNLAFLRSPTVPEGYSPEDYTLDDLEAAFNDLGEGVSYGTFEGSSAHNETTQSISLQLLTSILTDFGQAGGGDFGIGGSIQTNTQTGFGVIERTLRASSNFPNMSSLVITTEMARTTEVAPPSEVPVPAAVWLFGSGLVGLIGTARRRQAKAV